MVRTKIIISVIDASPIVSPGTPSLQFTLLNTSTYQNTVKTSGIRKTSYPKTEIEKKSRWRIPQKILEI